MLSLLYCLLSSIVFSFSFSLYRAACSLSFSLLARREEWQVQIRAVFFAFCVTHHLIISLHFRTSEKLRNERMRKERLQVLVFLNLRSCDVRKLCLLFHCCAHLLSPSFIV